LEFWPEYNGGPLWSTDGRTVEPETLGLRPGLCEALRLWNARFDDSKLPFETHDRQWIDEGVRLLADVRAALRDVDLIVTEPWWVG